MCPEITHEDKNFRLFIGKIYKICSYKFWRKYIRGKQLNLHEVQHLLDLFRNQICVGLAS